MKKERVNDEKKGFIHYELNKRRKATKVIVKYSNVVLISVAINILGIFFYHQFILVKYRQQNTSKILDIQNNAVEQIFWNISSYVLSVSDENNENSAMGILYKRGGYVLTTYSSIKDDESVVINYDGRSMNGNVIGKDDTVDIAVIKIEGESSLSGYNAGLPIIKKGDTIYGFYDENFEKQVSIGSIMEIFSQDNVHHIKNNITNIGDIGVFINNKSEIVGIKNSKNSSDIIYIGDIINSVEGIIRDYEGKSSNMGLVGRDATEEDEVDKGAYIINVSGVYKNSGLMPGDIVISVNGKKINNYKNFEEFMEKNYFNSKIKCNIVRDRKVIELTIENNID